MNERLIISPTTGKNNVEIVQTIDSSLIIDLYKKEFDIDVKRYFHGIDEIFICRCIDSGYRFYYPLTISGDSQFYEDLQNKVKFEYYNLKWEHIKAFEEINKDDCVLDIGCGSGLFLEKIMKKTAYVTGLEYNDLAIEKCAKKGINVVKSNIEEFSKNNIEYFDVVCAFQVLEHIVDIKAFIEACLKVLKPNGRLIIGVPNNNPYIFKHDVYHTLNLPPHHMGIWDKKALKKLPHFFLMKNHKLLIEPNFQYNYWLDIQLSYFLKNKRLKQILKKVFNRILKKIYKFTAGRNILVIYKK